MDFKQARDLAAVDDRAAVLPRPGPDVDHVVGGPDGLLVVLDDDDGVAQVAQAHQGVEQPAVVALVQPDGGLVEHVEHADQARADLAGQPDALGLAPRQRRRAARHGEVVEPDVEQEPQPGPHLAQHPVGDEVLALGQLERVHRLGRAW